MEQTTEKKRGILLTIWLILMLIANAAMALIYLIGGSFISELTSTISSWAIYTLGILAVLNFIFTIFLFMWKKWAFFAFCGSAVVALIINLIIGTNIIFSILSLIIGIGILYLILRPKWNLFD